MKKKTVIHITPHLGGGVGRVLLNYIANVKNDSYFVHEITCLDYANEDAKNTANSEGILLSDNFFDDHYSLIKKISTADIVIIHWWNHPLLYDFLVRESLPPSRVILWSHISGFNPPYVFVEPLFRYADVFVFTTPISFDAEEINALPEKYKEKIRVVWATAGTEHVADVRPKPHGGFNVGYIGTVDYCKLHPDFIKMSGMVDIEDARFIVCGGPMNKEIYHEAVKEGEGQRFSFEGHVDNINDYLSIFDIFGYPLAPYHYGTCEQALAEAMAAGVVPVVLANKTESYMVKDGVTGFVAKDESQYIQIIKGLYENTNLKITLSAKTKKEALKQFSLETMINEWDRIFKEILNFPKTPKRWTGRFNGSNVTYFQVFIESLGKYGKPFEDYLNAKNDRRKNEALERIAEVMNSNRIWKSKTRGSVYHYNNFFEDNLLREIADKTG